MTSYIKRAESPDLDAMEVPIAALRSNSFFTMLERELQTWQAANIGLEGNIAFAVWGGGAVEFLLHVLGYRIRHFTVHDLELLILRDEVIWYDEILVSSLDRKLRVQLGLRLGARPLYRRVDGKHIRDFQRTRVALRDGDLVLNNVLVTLSPRQTVAKFSAPRRAFGRINETKYAVDVKSWKDLTTLPRLFHRLSRSTSKAVRLEFLCGLKYSPNGLRAMKQLLGCYSILLDKSLKGSATSDDRKWLSDHGITTGSAGLLRLWEECICETAVRLAPVSGISIQDYIRFGDLVESLQCDVRTSSNLKIVRPPALFITPPSSWLEQIIDRSYARFREYQSQRSVVVASQLQNHCHDSPTSAC